MPAAATGPQTGSASSKKLSKPEAGQRKVDFFFTSTRSTVTQSTVAVSSAPASQNHRVPLAEVTESNNAYFTSKVVQSTVSVSSEPVSQNRQALPAEVTGSISPSPTDHSMKEVPEPKPPNRSSWEHKTWIETSFTNSMELFAQALDFFSQRRTEKDLTDFLQQIPEFSGWVHPLIPNFQRHRGKEAVLTILMCPKLDQRMDFSAPPPDRFSFTHALLLPMGNLIEQVTGMPSIAIDFRKECRRDDGHCAYITAKEAPRLAAATQVELLIARNVYDITFVHTITWSRDVSSTGGGLDQLIQLEPRLLGPDIDRIYFHPRIFTLVGMVTIFAQSTFWHGMYDYVFPILFKITGLPLDRIHDDLRQAWLQEEDNHLLRTVVASGETKVLTIASLPDILSTPRDLSKKTANNAMLASYALMASSPHAKTFAAKGLLPTWFLHQPREIPADFGPKRVRKSAARPSKDVQDASSVDGERRVVHPSPDPSAEDKAPRMMPNPVFDADFIMDSSAVVILPFYVGLTGSETLYSREQKNLKARDRKRERREADPEGTRKKQKEDYRKYKERLDNDPEMRDRTNAARRERRWAKKMAKNQMLAKNQTLEKKKLLGLD
ncbi:hypothetical protein EsH8_II_000162 [Colletotrichum jinshuiense]